MLAGTLPLRTAEDAFVKAMTAGGKKRAAVGKFLGRICSTAQGNLVGFRVRPVLTPGEPGRNLAGIFRVEEGLSFIITRKEYIHECV